MRRRRPGGEPRPSCSPHVWGGLGARRPERRRGLRRLPAPQDRPAVRAASRWSPCGASGYRLVPDGPLDADGGDRRAAGVGCRRRPVRAAARRRARLTDRRRRDRAGARRVVLVGDPAAPRCCGQRRRRRRDQALGVAAAGDRRPAARIRCPAAARPSSRSSTRRAGCRRRRRGVTGWSRCSTRPSSRAPGPAPPSSCPAAGSASTSRCASSPSGAGRTAAPQTVLVAAPVGGHRDAASASSAAPCAGRRASRARRPASAVARAGCVGSALRPVEALTPRRRRPPGTPGGPATAAVPGGGRRDPPARGHAQRHARPARRGRASGSGPSSRTPRTSCAARWPRSARRRGGPAARRRQATPTGATRSADGVLEDTARMSRLVDDLLLLARLDDARAAAGRGRPPGRPAAVADRVVERLERQHGRSVRVRPGRAAERSPCRRRDDALERVVVNLVENAVRYARSRVEVTVQGSRRGRPADGGGRRPRRPGRRPGARLRAVHPARRRPQPRRRAAPGSGWRSSGNSSARTAATCTWTTLLIRRRRACGRSSACRPPRRSGRVSRPGGTRPDRSNRSLRRLRDRHVARDLGVDAEVVQGARDDGQRDRAPVRATGGAVASSPAGTPRPHRSTARPRPPRRADAQLPPEPDADHASGDQGSAGPSAAPVITCTTVRGRGAARGGPGRPPTAPRGRRPGRRGRRPRALPPRHPRPPPARPSGGPPRTAPPPAASR